LSGRVHGLGHSKVYSRSATVFLYADRLWAGYLSARNSFEPARKAAESVSLSAVAVPPVGEPLDVGGSASRSQSQSADRLGARACHPTCRRIASAAGGVHTLRR